MKGIDHRLKRNQLFVRINKDESFNRALSDDCCDSVCLLIIVYSSENQWFNVK